MRRGILVLAAAAATLCMTGCTPYTGINSLSLPGTVGTGSDSYQVQVQLKNANNLVPNTPVLVDDINVGTVTKVGLDGWTPTLTLSLRKGVRLPANAVASLGQTSLLGSKHIQLSAPAGQPAQGTLAAGALIGEDQTHEYPETEDLLSGVSLLLNGGGLQHFETITSELNRALGGREGDVRDLFGQLNDFTGGLDKQKDDIVTALKGLDRFGGTLAPRMSEIDTALQRLPDGLRTLDEQEPALTDALQRLGDGSESIAPFADDGSQNLRDVLHDVEPVLRHTADIQEGSLPRDLRILGGVIFPLDAVPYLVRGDYANLNLPINLTFDSLDQGLLTGTPGSGLLHGAANVIRGTDPGSQSGNPLLLPGTQDSKAPSGVLPTGPQLPADHGGPGLVHTAVPGIGG
jgi:phospholipid/cholesterol/gamma-HCH transport system substrate-binding protein